MFRFITMKLFFYACFNFFFITFAFLLRLLFGYYGYGIRGGDIGINNGSQFCRRAKLDDID